MSEAYPSIKPIACINGMTLKIIAIVSMIIDHIGLVLFPGQNIYRAFGRLAFPIYIFLLVEGFLYTKHLLRYELSLLIFAFVSEIPFDLAFEKVPIYSSYQNVFFTLLLGVLMMHVITLVSERAPLGYFEGILVELLILAVFAAVAFLIHCDYESGGILLIYCFYKFRDMHLIKYGLSALIMWLFYRPLQMYALFAFIPLLLYNGKRGFRQDGRIYSGSASGPVSVFVKYLFYIVYPVHLLILYFIYVAIR